MEKERKLARERAAIILQVRSGALTATEGAERLGVSRKTYYEWEDRALKAMALALENHSPGRPSVPPDAEKEDLQSKVRDLEKRLYLAEKTIEVKDLLSAYDLHEAKKNKTKQQKGGKRRSGK
jgi:transposase